MTRTDRAFFQALNRRIKAHAFIRIIDASGMRPTPIDVLEWDDDVWLKVAELARLADDVDYSDPSDETIRLVADILERRERFFVGEKVTLGRPRKTRNVLPFAGRAVAP